MANNSCYEFYPIDDDEEWGEVPVLTPQNDFDLSRDTNNNDTEWYEHRIIPLLTRFDNDPTREEQKELDNIHIRKPEAVKQFQPNVNSSRLSPVEIPSESAEKQEFNVGDDGPIKSSQIDCSSDSCLSRGMAYASSSSKSGPKEDNNDSTGNDGLNPESIVGIAEGTPEIMYLIKRKSNDTDSGEDRLVYVTKEYMAKNYPKMTLKFLIDNEYYVMEFPLEVAKKWPF